MSTRVFSDEDLVRLRRFPEISGDELIRYFTIDILRELNASGARAVPADAPTSFVPARWQGYLTEAAAAGDTAGYRRDWELAVLLCLRDRLRSGDVHVPGSRGYADPTAYLITAEYRAVRHHHRRHRRRARPARSIRAPSATQPGLCHLDTVRLRMGYCNKSIMLGRGPAPGVELRVAIQVVRRRLGDEFREPARSLNCRPA